MTTTPLKTQGNLALSKGQITVPPDRRLGRKSFVIMELSLAKYTEFLALWEQATAQIEEFKTETFAVVWAKSPEFRHYISQALELYGINQERLDSLTPTQVKELVLVAKVGDETLPGLLFHMHDELPPKMQPLQNLKVPSSQPLKGHGLPYRFWAYLNKPVSLPWAK